MAAINTLLVQTDDNTYEIDCPDCGYRNDLPFIHEKGYCRKCKATFDVTPQ